MTQTMSARSQALVIADDPAYLPWLETALGDSVNFVRADTHDVGDLLRRLQQGNRFDLLFCEFEDYNAPERAALVEAVADRLPDLPVVAIGSSENAATVLSAMRAGVRDFFVLKRDDAKLAAQVGKLLRRLGAASVVAAASSGQGRVYTVVGAQPHESVAFLAMHIALAAAERNRQQSVPGRVLLIDAAMPAGAASIFLNLSPSYSVLDAVNDVHRCDATLVDTAFIKHNAGVHLLSLPEEGLGRPAMAEDDFGRLLQVFKSLFSVVVVALDGQAGTPLLRAAIAQSTRTLLLTDQSILKSRQSKYLLRALRLDDTPLDNTALVVDNYRRRLGLEPQNLAELFDLPLLATLTSDGVARIQAMNSGESMFAIAPKDPYCEGVRRLTQSLATGETVAAGAKGDGLLNRLFR